jgi:hypothetical protein
MTYQHIADELGYSSAGEARKQIMKALDAVPVAEVEELRRIQVQRLESLLESVWPAAQRGNMRAVNTAERIVAQITSLMGLQAAPSFKGTVHQHFLLTLGGGNLPGN